MGVFSTFGLQLVAGVFLFGCNLFFSILFLKQTPLDNAFKFWTKNFKFTMKLIVGISGALNFKLFRIIYGRFLNKPHFNAVFDDPQVFFKPFTLVSIFSVVTTMLPIIISNICGLVFIEYGYQFTMTCIELTIIELVILALMIFEKFRLRHLVEKESSYFKVGPRHF